MLISTFPTTLHRSSFSFVSKLSVHLLCRSKDNDEQDVVFVKLSDYGISQWANAKGRAKGFGGTEGYIPPEVYKHRGREAFNTKVCGCGVR